MALTLHKYYALLKIAKLQQTINTSCKDSLMQLLKERTRTLCGLELLQVGAGQDEWPRICLF